MKKILIANLGNRNITYKGSYYQELSKSKAVQTDFRTWTENLWQNYDTEALHIRPAILDTLIEAVKHEISRVIMFSSDQPPEIRRTQDTCFEGKILQRWFREKHPEIQFENWEMDTPVTNNEALLRAYQQEIRKMTKRYPDRQYILCEAGGTAQQKSSLKIMLEYLMEADDFEMYYVPQNREGVSGKPQKTDNIQYRKILDALQIERLIQNLQYDAAKEIYSTENKEQKPIYRLLHFGSLRVKQHHQSARNYIHQFKKRLQEQEILKFYKEFDPDCMFKGWLKEVFNKKESVFLISERLFLAQKYLQIRDYSQGAIKLQIFLETYLQEVLTQHHLGYENLNYFQLKSMVEEDLKNERWQNVKDWQMATQSDNRDGIPSRVLVAQNINNQTHQQILADFCEITQRLNKTLFDNNPHSKIPLDKLRNDLAHRGEGATKEEFLKIPDIEEKLNRWYTYFHFGLNPYDELNEKIVALLKEGR